MRSEKIKYSRVNLFGLLRSQRNLPFFPILDQAFESLKLKGKGKHRTYRGYRCGPGGRDKIAEIIFQESSYIEFERIKVKIKPEVPLKTNGVVIRDFRRPSLGVIASKKRNKM